MTTAGIRRALTPTEEIYAAVEMYVGYTVRTAGRLDPDALQTAYEAVCRAYPQLASRLEYGDDGPVLAEFDTRPEVQFSDGDLGRPLVRTDLDQHRSLSALDVVRDGDRASVTLVTHHSIADAHQSLAVLADLWSCYTDAVHGVPVELPRRPCPRSLEDLLAERGIHGVSVAATDTPEPSPGKDRPTTGSAGDTLVRHVAQYRLTAARTSALSEFCHREHVTIHGLLSGAILLVEAELRDLPLTDLVYRYTVDLRGRLTPRIGPAEGTNVLGGVVFRAADGIRPDAVTLGRAIGEQLRAGLADGSIQRSLLDMVAHHRRADAAPPPQLSTPAVISMTNWGPVPPLRTPGDLLLTNFHSSSRRRVAPEDTANVGGYVVTTFDGRLGIDLAWPTKDTEQTRRLDCLRERLSDMLRA